MNGVYLAAALGLLSTTLGIFLTLYLNSRRQKMKETFSLYKEFSSEEMKKSRNLAFKLLLKHPELSYDKLSDLSGVEESNALWHVLGFYQRLWILIEFKEVSKKIIPRLFGDLFLWWYEFTFKTQLMSANWEVSEDIQKLYDWLKRNSKKAQFEKWQLRIDKEINIRVTNLRSRDGDLS